MSYYRMTPLLRRWLAAILALYIGLGPLGTPAFSALTPLGDQPLNIQNSAQPNIVLTIDDSTSMLDDFLPDYVVNAYCRDGVGAMNARCGSGGATNDFTAIGGGKYYSPGWTSQQYAFPYTTFGTGGGAYTVSGPGAGCFGGSPPTCSGGINPGGQPGISVYPAGPVGWPNAGLPYEYWLLWPAPPHSNGLNALAYDPTITYLPPVDSTGASLPQMDAAGTTNWTIVPADRWASPVTNVDLTQSVNVGQWCNTDWSIGLDTNPQVCRINGSNAAAFGTVTAPQGADYTYPWAPPNFTVSASAGATTAQTYAAQKVTLGTITINGVLMTGTGTAIDAANWNATSKDPRYFYENENIIWCDPTSPSWPQGTPLGQTCQAPVAQTCTAAAQTCTKAPGACNGYVAGQCNGLITGTCNGFQASTCTGTAAVCNNAPSCIQPSCGNSRPETCVGTVQTCPTSAQTCSGPFGQVCNLPGTQTCQPPVCTVTYNPPGCNLLPPDPENPCTPVTTCAPPVCTPNPGTCSIQTTKSCTQNSDCTPQPGQCSISHAPCMSVVPDCPPLGNCSTTGQSCSSASTCPIVGGHCSLKAGQACTKDSDCPQFACGGAGPTAGQVCALPSDCFYCSSGAIQLCPSGAATSCSPGNCSQKSCTGNPSIVCSTTADCTAAGTTGPCTQSTCTTAATCPIKAGTCTTPAGKACGSNAQCAVKLGFCSDFCDDGKTACTNNGQCKGIGSGKCGNGTPGKSCSVNTDCTFAGTCNTGGSCTVNATGTPTPPGGCPEVMGTCAKDPTVQCRAASDCASVGTCANTHSACNSKVPCANIAGHCSISGQSCDCAVNNNGVFTCNTNGATLASECPPLGTCSITGGTCTTSGDCPGTNQPLPPSGVTCSTGGVGGVAATTLRHDAETNGIVCRRNNQTSVSAAYSSGAYDYPSGKFLTPITNGSGPDACTVTNHYIAVPPHYWISAIEWCDSKVATVGDQWFGFGTDVGGTCQAGKDSTHVYPRFFQFGNLSYVDNKTTAAFQRVVLDITKPGAMYTFNWQDATGPQTVTRTFAQEMTNYANWFAYYRTRIQAVKTVTTLTFTALDNTYRVGFHTLSNGLTTAAGQSDPATFVDIQNFDAAQKAKWWTQLFAISIPLALETPTLDAMVRIGDYYLNGGSAVLAGATDPIILSCQKNWHMLFTDGFTNQLMPTTLVGDNDLTVPAAVDPILMVMASDLPTGRTGAEPRVPVLSLDPAAAGGSNVNWPDWPHPFTEDTSATASNSASDYAMHYWEIDLRNASRPNNQNNVPATAKDPATWQHVNFAALSLGTQGKLPVANQSITEAALAKNPPTLQWPQPVPTTWKPDNSGVDDLWHAAINGRGRFVNAQTAAELKLGMGQILEDITNQAGARSGAGFASGSISVTNHAVYIVTFQPGWAGTLSKVELDTKTGAELSTDWEAATQLSNQLAITVPDPAPWFTNRHIFTVQDATMPAGGGGPGAAVPFLWADLSAAQQDSLAPGQPAVGQAVLEFLRGNPTNEGVAIGQFRVRGTGPSGSEDFLGDIVDSQAVYVGPPNFPYLDANDPGYSGFVASKSGRPARVYVAANDGMAHAFDDATGNEVWAFVPNELYRPDNTGLGALSYQDGGLPAFKHHYYVDSTPRVYDVNFGGGPSDWHSLMVGGLGKGGHSYYAIDVTNPGAVTSEATAASQYLWTFTDPDMGFSYGRPILTKTHATVAPFTSGQWVAIVTAGYNNASGLGKIFFIDAKTGTKLKEMNTGFGTAANPSGMTYLVGYTKDFHNQLVENIYAGDLYGNFWRFDLSDPDPANWVVNKLAYLTDPGGSPQPVTTAPTVDVDITNGVDRWVFVGTGRLLDQTDLTTPSIANQQQTLYAIRDGTAITPSADAVPLQPRNPGNLVPLTAAQKVSGLSGTPAKGWYDDLPPGQRIVSPVRAALSLVAYAGTAAQNNPCLTGEPATLYVRSFATGQSLIPSSTAGYDPITGGVAEATGAVGLDVTVFTDTGTGTAAGPDIRVAVTTAAGTLIFQETLTQTNLANSRMSWRLFGQ